MFYTARLVSDSFEDDPDKRGYIKVLYQQQEQWARPASPFGTFMVPTKEWIKKYAANNAIDVFVTYLNNEKYLVWTGFTVYQDKLPADAMKNYAYRRITFTENWTSWFDDKDKQNTYIVKHKDGTLITIDRTPGSESVKIDDPKLKNTLLMDKTGIKVNGSFVVLKGFIDLLIQNAAMIGIDSNGGPVQIAPTLLSNLQLQLAQANKITSNQL